MRFIHVCNETFVRFVVGRADENAAWLTGVTTIARVVRDEGKLEEYETQVLEDAFAWLNDHLPHPPFDHKLRTQEWSDDAVCWFRSEAKEAISKIWDIVALLREHGVPVRMVVTDKPGIIVYQDAYQIVAETPKWA